MLEILLIICLGLYALLVSPIICIRWIIWLIAQILNLISYVTKLLAIETAIVATIMTHYLLIPVKKITEIPIAPKRED